MGQKVPYSVVEQPTGKILISNQILYKVIFLLLSFIAIGISYSLVLHLEGKYLLLNIDVLKFILISASISSIFILTGFILTFVVLTLYHCDLKKAKEYGVQDFYVVLGSIASFIIYGFFLYVRHTQLLIKLILG